MPPRRARARKGPSTKQDVLRLSSANELPQELIDVIIDEFDVWLTDENHRHVFPDRKALRSCALVSRAFVRPSQAKLFSVVNLYSGYGESPDERSRLLSKLLSSRPHIGFYVRILLLSYRSARSKSVEHILSSLPRLTSLSLHPVVGSPYGWHPAFPAQLRDSFLAILSTSSLRRIELKSHRFDNPQELQHILSNSPGLKELVLDNITIDAMPPHPVETNLGSPRTVLESLSVFTMLHEPVDVVLNTFTVIDIMHLRSISCDRYHKTLIQANASSIRDLTLIIRGNGGLLYREGLDTILTPLGSLRTLHFVVEHFGHFCNLIDGLGSWATLKALKKLSISVPSPHFDDHPLMWSKIDSHLADDGSELEAVHIFIRRSHNGAQAGQFMPALDAKRILEISPTPRSSEFSYMHMSMF